MPTNTPEGAFSSEVAGIVELRASMTDEELREALDAAVANLLMYGVPIGSVRVEESIDFEPSSSDKDSD